MVRLERDAQHLCARFGLRYRVLEAERANVKRRYGVCFSDGTIRIRLRHAATGKPLKYSSLVNTLCHELAHLRHFNHGPHFQAFYARILEWARREGIYQPKSAGEAGWRGGMSHPEAVSAVSAAMARAPGSRRLAQGRREDGQDGALRDATQGPLHRPLRGPRHGTTDDGRGVPQRSASARPSPSVQLELFAN